MKSLLADQSFTPEFKMAQEQFFFPEVPVILAAGERQQDKTVGTDGRFEDGFCQCAGTGSDHLRLLYGGRR